MISKVYAVVEFGEHYGESIEKTIAICSTLKIAEKLKAEIEKKFDSPNLAISKEDWGNIIDTLFIEAESGYQYDDFVTGIKNLFPKYSEEEIEQAIDTYHNYSDWEEVEIREIDFYTELSDISNNESNC